MTKKEVLTGLDFEVAKKVIARRLGTRKFDFNVKSNGTFSIDLKKLNNKALDFVFNGANKLTLVSDQVKVTNNGNYKAIIMLKGPVQFNVAELRYSNNKWECVNTVHTPIIKTRKTSTRQRKKTVSSNMTSTERPSMAAQSAT